MQIDWGLIFIPTTPLPEIVLRGTIIYLFLFFVLRLLRREAGSIGIPDLLVVVLIADASQNAMSSDAKSITEGVILIGTIALWDYLLDWLGYRVPYIRRLLRPAPLLLIKQGRLQRKNMRQEMITLDELMSQLREHGLERADQVKKCYLEGDGSISIIKMDANN